jgi:Spy/CpxP family protein refolding chaperone
MSELLSAAIIRNAKIPRRVEKFVTARPHARSSPSKAQKGAFQKRMKPTMKRNILALAATGAIALGSFVVVQAQPGPDGPGHCRGHAFGLKGITENLNLTADQQTKVQPILDAAKPQIAAIHQEAMQKMHTVMNDALTQIRPLLDADQQKKLDAIEKAHQDMRNASKQLHDALQD